ncbi:MAG: Ldh family oxidoreductase [Gemmatimonadetes bacterium]|nr:Ldh family oxidoreductase [Gemmatimonadota bacterium]
MPVCVPEDARRIMPDMLRDFTIDVLRKVDLPADDAALVARYLVDVDLRGVVSHGTRQLRRYVASFARGVLIRDLKLPKSWMPLQWRFLTATAVRVTWWQLRRQRRSLKRRKQMALPLRVRAITGTWVAWGFMRGWHWCATWRPFPWQEVLRGKNRRSLMQRCGMRCEHPRCVLAFQRQKGRRLCWI